MAYRAQGLQKNQSETNPSNEESLRGYLYHDDRQKEMGKERKKGIGSDHTLRNVGPKH